jgi:hypothetical protein
VPKNKIKAKDLRVRILLPHTSPGNAASRKQRHATNTRIYHFTGDKTSNRKKSSLLTTSSFEQLPPLDCKCKANDSQRITTF